MINPCKECLVKVACTAICQPKQEYQDLIIRHLIEFSNEYLYSKDQVYMGTDHLNFKQTQFHEYLRKKCDENSQDFQRIFSREGRFL